MKTTTEGADVRAVNANELALQLTRPGAARLNLRKFPDFMVVGPQRTGTSWLDDNLRRHPGVFLPRRKEIYFFNLLEQKQHPKFRSDELSWYLRHFRDTPMSYVKKQFAHRRAYGRWYKPQVRGECTASYAVMGEEVIREIVKLNAGLRAILMVRDPVARAWSHAKKDLVVRRKRASMADVPDAEFMEFFQDPYQLACGRYSVSIARWQRALAPGHLFIGRFEDIVQRPEELLRQLYAFLGLDWDERYASVARKKVNPTNEEAIPDRYKGRLTDLFGDEIEYLKQIQGSGDAREVGAV